MTLSPVRDRRPGDPETLPPVRDRRWVGRRV